MSEKYQNGSIRKVGRARGKKAWEWRYRVNGKMCQQTFPAEDFPTVKALKTHLETRVKLVNEGQIARTPHNATMGELIAKYMAKRLPELAKSTRDTDGSMLRVHFLPRWEKTLVADVHAEEVEDRIKTLRSDGGKPLAASSRDRARRLMKQLIDRAMFWRFLPTRENPIKLVRVKGVTKREKRITATFQWIRCRRCPQASLFTI